MSLNRYFKLLKEFNHNKRLSLKSKKLLILSTDSNDFLINCSIAHVLVKLGHKVTLFIQNSGQSLNKKFYGLSSHKNFLSLIKVIIKNEIYVEYGEEVVGKISNISIKLRKIIYRQTQEDVQRILKNPVYEKNKKNKKLFEQIERKNFNFAIKFKSFVKNNEFDNYIIDSGSWAEYGVAFSILQELGKTITCYGYRNDKNSIMISKNSPFNNLNIDEAWEELKNKPISKSNFTIERISKKKFYKKDVFLNFHREDPLNKEIIYKRLFLKRNNYTILILTNLAFDTTVLTKKTNYLFKSHFDWLKRTIDFLIQKKNCNIIIRPHPAEKLTNCYMTCEKYINNYFEKLGESFTILPSQTSINTYGLIDIADLGLVYSSDVGWEMVLKNKPVISGGMGAAWGKNIQYDPKSLKDYFNKINIFIKNKKVAVPNSKKINAFKFMNFYMQEVPKTFPFPLFEYWNKHTFNEAGRIFQSSTIPKKYKKTFEDLSDPLLSRKGVI